MIFLSNTNEVKEPLVENIEVLCHSAYGCRIGF